MAAVNAGNGDNDESALDHKTKAEDHHTAINTSSEMARKFEKLLSKVGSTTKRALSEYYLALKPQERAYAKFEDFHKINIIRQDKLNRQALRQRLLQLTGPLTDEMRNHIKAIRQPDQFLTPPEKKFLKQLLKGAWVLKHATHSYEIIKRTGNDLLSLGERARREDNCQNSNTLKSDGNDDNVFFSMGPETVRFLDSASTVIELDLSKIEEEGLFPLTGLWSSGHLYAFFKEQTGTPIKFFGTEYTVSYHRWLPEGLEPAISEFPEQDIPEARERDRKEKHEKGPFKVCKYKLPNGKIVSQILQIKDEIFINPRIELAVGLMAIERIRLMGKAAWDGIMAADIETQQKVVQNLFHPGIFELHKPAFFSLDQPGVTIHNQPYMGFHATSAEESILKPLIEAALRGDADTVLKSLHADLSIEKLICFPGPTYLNLIGAAILGGSEPLVRVLLQGDPDLNATRGFCKIPKALGNNPFTEEVNLLSLSVMGPKTKERIIKSALKLDPSTELKISDEDARTIFRLLRHEGSCYRQEPNITRPLEIDLSALSSLICIVRPTESLLLEILDQCEPKKHVEHLPILEAVHLKWFKVVDKLIQMGANVNIRADRTRTFSDADHDALLPLGYTPLISAVTQDELEMAELLIKNKADVNASFCTQKSKSIFVNVPAFKVVEKEGYTPLMFAAENKNVEMARLLLKNGARSDYRSLKGHTALSIAKAKEHHEMVALLMASRPSIEDAPPQPQASLFKAAESFWIHDHLTSVVMTGVNQNGERYFLVYQSEHDYWLNHFLSQKKEPLRLFTKETWEKNLVDEFFKIDVDLDPATGKWSEIGMLSCAIEKDSVHYAHQFLCYEFDLTTFQILLKYPETVEDYKLVSEKELQKSMEESKLTQEVICSGITLTHPAALLLRHVSKKISNKLEEDRKQLEEMYEAYLSTQHRFVDCARMGDISGVEALLKQGINISIRIPTVESQENTHKGYTQTALTAAINAAQPKVVQVLIRDGVLKNERFHSSELLKLIENGNKAAEYQAFVRLLLSVGSQLSETDFKENLRFHIPIAVKYDQPEIFRFLLDEIFAEPERMKDFLEKAFSFKAIAILKMILTRAPNAVTFVDLTSLLRQEDAELFKIVLPFIKFTTQNDTYDYLDGLFLPLYSVTKIEFIISVLNELLDPNGVWSPFVPAIAAVNLREKNPELRDRIAKLYEDRAPNLCSAQAAIQKGDLDSVLAFLKSGMSVNAYLLKISEEAPYFSFTNPIQIALENKHYHLAKILIDKGANLANVKCISDDIQAFINEYGQKKEVIIEPTQNVPLGEERKLVLECHQLESNASFTPSFDGVKVLDEANASAPNPSTIMGSATAEVETLPMAPNG